MARTAQSCPGAFAPQAAFGGMFCDLPATGMIRHIALVLTVLYAVATSAGAGAGAVAADLPTQVRFASVAVGRIPAGPELTGWIYRPAGAGPFPAIVFAHSCAGYGPRVDEWGWRLASWGYLVLAPDSFGPRGKSRVCGMPGIVTPDMRVADIAGALDHLRTRPDVKPGHVGLMGQSHGGSTTLKSLQKGHDLARRGLRGGVAYYPGCSARRDRDVGLPLLILIGEKDDWTRAQWCHELQAAGFRQPALVEVTYYPNAYHSFDGRTNQTIQIGDRAYRLEHDPVATPDAEARTRAFFDRLLR